MDEEEDEGPGQANFDTLSVGAPNLQWPVAGFKVAYKESHRNGPGTVINHRVHRRTLVEPDQPSVEMLQYPCPVTL